MRYPESVSRKVQATFINIDRFQNYLVVKFNIIIKLDLNNMKG